MNQNSTGSDRKTLIDSLRKISEAQSDSFSELALLAGLDPRTDFQNADLRDANLEGENLAQFDFSGSDLTGANMKGTVFNEISRRSMIIDSAASGKHKQTLHERLNAVNESSVISPPFAAIEKIHELRFVDVQARIKILRDLLFKYAGYKENRLEQLAGTKFSVPFVKTPYKQPFWLKELLIEAKAFYWPHESFRFVDRAFSAIFGKDISEKDLTKRQALHGKFDHERIRSIERLAKDFSDDIEVQDLIFEIAFSDAESHIREVALDNLVVTEGNNERIKEHLVSSFLEMDDTPIRGRFLKALGTIQEVDDDVIKLIFSTATDRNDNWSRREALLIIASYYQFGGSTAEAIIYIVIDAAINGLDGVKQIAFAILGLMLKEEVNGREILEKLYDVQSSSVGKFCAFQALYDNFQEREKIDHIAKRIGKRTENEGPLFFGEIVRLGVTDRSLFSLVRDRLFEDVFDERIADWVRRKIVLAVHNWMQIEGELVDWIVRVGETPIGPLTQAEAVKVMIENVERVPPFSVALRRIFERHPEIFSNDETTQLFLSERGWIRG